MDKFNIIAPVSKAMTEDEDYFYVSGIASSVGNIDRDGDVIDVSAFDVALAKEYNRPLLLEHRVQDRLGGITKLSKAGNNIYVEARLPKDKDIVREAITDIKSGALGNFSIGFRVMEAERIAKSDSRAPDEAREMNIDPVLIKKIDLYEVSLVAIPANPNAIVTGFKAFNNYLEENGIDQVDAESVDIGTFLSWDLKVQEKALRLGVPLSRKASTLIVSKLSVNDEIDQQRAGSVDIAAQLQKSNKDLKQLFNQLKGN